MEAQRRPHRPRLSVRWLLGAVTVLAACVFGVAVLGISQVTQLTVAQRLERARASTAHELEALATAGDAVAELARPAPYVGMRGGIALVQHVDEHGRALRTGAPLDVDRALSTLVRTASSEASLGMLESGSNTIIFGAQRRLGGDVAWATYSVAPPRLIGTLRELLVVLTAVTLLLGLVAMLSVVAVTRGARSLKASLAAVARSGDGAHVDIPRPSVAELASVADGVESLARNLQKSREEREVLAGELRRQERVAALGRVVAGVSHEIRNPLASMKLRLDIARQSALPADVESELAVVDEEISRLDRLVTEFLVVSGRRLGPKALTNLGDLARRRVEQLAPWAREHEVSIEVVGDACATIDRDAWSRAVDNLLRNAVEASPHGGVVRVRVHDEGDVARTVVEDCGDGVPPEHLHQLFEPFFTTKPEGTGLGLAVSRAIAQASGGDLLYRRESGTTRFSIAVHADNEHRRSAA